MSPQLSVLLRSVEKDHEQLSKEVANKLATPGTVLNLKHGVLKQNEHIQGVIKLHNNLDETVSLHAIEIKNITDDFSEMPEEILNQLNNHKKDIREIETKNKKDIEELKDFTIKEILSLKKKWINEINDFTSKEKRQPIQKVQNKIHIWEFILTCSIVIGVTILLIPVLENKYPDNQFFNYLGKAGLPPALTKIKDYCVFHKKSYEQIALKTQLSQARKTIEELLTAVSTLKTSSKT